MKPNSARFLRDLAALIERFQVKIDYTINDDGVHFHLPGDDDLFVGFIDPATSPSEMRTAASVQAVSEWQSIETAPKDGATIIVGFDSASVWIVRNAWWRGESDIRQMRDFDSDADETDIGWWSYSNSVTQEMIEPTHWLCVEPEPPII